MFLTVTLSAWGDGPSKFHCNRITTVTNIIIQRTHAYGQADTRTKLDVY